MPTTYSTNLAISLIATGEQAGNWGNITNTNLGTLIEQAISGYVTQAITDGADTSISIPQGSTGVARNMCLELTGALTAARNLIVPANRKLYFIYNNTTGGYPVTVKVSGQTGVSVPNGRKMVLVSNGTDVVQAADYTAISYAGSFNPLGSSVPTNGVYLPAANTVGIAANSNEVVKFSNGIQVGSPTGGFLGLGTLNATGLFVNGNAVGVGTGTVTSVTGTGTVNGISLSGTGTGAVTLTLGGSLSAINLTSQVTGVLPIANGGTGASTASNAINALVPSQTGNGGKYLKTDGSVVSWDTVAAGGGTVTSVSMVTTGTGLLVSGGTSQTITGSGTFTITGTLDLDNGGTGATTASGARTNLGLVIGTDVLSPTGNGSGLTSLNASNLASGTVAVGRGGTGVVTTPSNGQLLIGNGSGYQVANLTAGSNITITNSAGGITIAASGSTGVSSISFGSTGLTPNTATTGAVTVAGTLAVGNGGTGATTLTGVLKGNGTSAFSAATAGTDFVAPGGALGTPSSGTLTNCTGLPVSTGISGLGTGVATFLATPSSANLAAAVTNETGSGALVFATSPTLVTPVLGTPSSGNLSSCTADGTNAVGFRNIPQDTSTTLAAASVGKHHYVSAGVTINTGVFSIGDAFMIVNSGTSNITITQGASVTLRLAGTATTGSRTLAQKGIASVLCVAANDFIVSGVGVT